METAKELEKEQRRYLVITYHHIENGFDEKLDYHTLLAAIKAAQGYVDGSMEPDGFVYDGAAVYDQKEKKYLRIFGDYPDKNAQINRKGKNMAAEKQIKKAQKEQMEDLRRRKKELASIEANAYARRVAFVKALDPAVAEPYIGPLALYTMRHSFFIHGITNLEELQNCLDISDMLQGNILSNRHTATPAYLLLLNYTLSPLIGCFHHYKRFTQELIHLSEDCLSGEYLAMNDLYDILIALGYQMTEQERQWRDGSHCAYQNKPLEAFLAVQ